VTAIHADPDRPLIVLHDTFGAASDANSKAPVNNLKNAELRPDSGKVMTLQLLATGDVQTPSGKISPPLRKHPPSEHKGESNQPLPSTTPAIKLAKGVHRFGFTGKHDVDCDVYVLADSPQEALIGNWTVTPWGGAVTDKDESQHILRVRGSGQFTMLLVPRKRNSTTTATVTAQEGGFIVKSGPTTTTIASGGYSVTKGGTILRRVFD
jgi:hypothetical protein